MQRPLRRSVGKRPMALSWISEYPASMKIKSISCLKNNRAILCASLLVPIAFAGCSSDPGTVAYVGPPAVVVVGQPAVYVQPQPVYYASGPTYYVAARPGYYSHPAYVAPRPAPHPAYVAQAHDNQNHDDQNQNQNQNHPQ
jgi:hypothetical protein